LQERYELVLPPGYLDAIAERTNEVFRSFPGAVTKRRSASWFGGVELVVYELELPSPIAAEAWTSTINAGRFVHDGARRSEGDSRYFWIWVDRGRHLRVILGAIPVRKCTLRVVIAKVVDHANLETPLLLLNGERLAKNI
jgi:hypothetical protein